MEFLSLFVVSLINFFINIVKSYIYKKLIYKLFNRNSIIIINIMNNSNSSLIQNITNSSLIQNITNSSLIQNITNSSSIQAIISISPTPTLLNITNITVSINLSSSGTQQIINTSISSSPSQSATAIYNSMVSPTYSPSTIPKLVSSVNNNLIDITNPNTIGVLIGIILSSIIIGIILSYFCLKKNIRNEKEEADKYMLPSMTYSPHYNRSAVKSIFQKN